MFRNFFKTALKALNKNKGFTAINIIGLSAGIAACLLIVFYVMDELSCDKCNVNANRVYRITENARLNGSELSSAATEKPLKDALTALPEIEKTTRLVACLSLFALAPYAAGQRNKEIAIRKVIGANTSNIINILSTDFIKLVCISILIASPIGGFAMNRWLQDFAYRINISWRVFFVAGLIAIAIALITISFQATKVAIANPVKSLRTE